MLQGEQVRPDIMSYNSSHSHIAVYIHLAMFTKWQQQLLECYVTPAVLCATPPDT